MTEIAIQNYLIFIVGNKTELINTNSDIWIIYTLTVYVLSIINSTKSQTASLQKGGTPTTMSVKD